MLLVCTREVCRPSYEPSSTDVHESIWRLMQMNEAAHLGMVYGFVVCRRVSCLTVPRFAARRGLKVPVPSHRRLSALKTACVTLSPGLSDDDDRDSGTLVHQSPTDSLSLSLVVQTSCCVPKPPGSHGYGYVSNSLV